jgi:hypothetical protein
MKKQKLFLMMAGCLLAFLSMAQTKIVSAEWAAFSDNNTPAALVDTVYKGKSCIKLDGMKQAVAFRKDISLRNFRIDFDLASQSMGGVGFHASDEQNYHFLYFRPGYGGTKEAIQYVPVYNGALSWVLYNYPIYETTADTKQLEWFHVAIEVKNNHMKVFVNNSSAPQMEIDLIASGFNDGKILLRTMFGNSYIANVGIIPFPEVLTDWEISEQFPRKATLELDLSAKSASWTSVKSDQADIINICRYVKNPNGVVMARHTLKSDNDKEMILFFDFIGKMKVFLNGKELFRYEKFKLDRIFAGTEQIVLHVKKGNNELVFVSEGDAFTFGKGFDAMGRIQHQNWGFTAEVMNN